MTLYRKYRPQNFKDLYGQDHIRDTLLQAVKEDRLSQAYLFAGPRGTGKTSTARLIARVANCLEIDKNRKTGEIKSGEPCGKCLNCLDILEGRSLDIIEIDAASNRGIDEIRQLREQVKFAPASGKYKIYIIDEVHMLTREAFNALLKTLEEPPTHAIFILATTEPQKVLPTIISRTQRFDFGRISLTSLTDNLERVAKAEKFNYSRDALEIIAHMAEGGGRDSLSLLEQVSSYSNDISVDNVKKILGLTESGQVIGLIRAIFNCEAEEGLKIAQGLYDSGSNIAQLNNSILGVLRKILNWLVAGDFLIDDTAENKKNLADLCSAVKNRYPQNSTSSVLAVIREFVEANKNLKETVDPLMAIEVAIVSSTESLKPSLNMGSEFKKASDPAKVLTVASKEQKDPDAALNDKEFKLKVQNDKLSDKKDFSNDQDSSNKKVDVSVSQEAPLPSDSPSALLSDLPDDIWGEVIGALKKDNSTLAALLKDARPITVESGKVVLGVRFKFHKDKISEAKNLKLLEGVICSVTKSNCRVMCEIANFSSQPKKAASDDELAEEAEKVFGE
ncbi:MAG: DNA polymerase III subunit tau [bacterium ADurb.Bin212]|nr:MAG: DNA polymerase III subunit tau [bacterium ADurb.Bin212]